MVHCIDVAYLLNEEEPTDRSRQIQRLWDQLYSIDRILSRPSLGESAIIEFEVSARIVVYRPSVVVKIHYHPPL